MKKVNLVDFTDILHHATTLGYEWNNACDLLDDLRPQYECRSLDYDIKDEDDWNKRYNKKVVEVLKSFMIENEIKKMTVIDE